MFLRRVFVGREARDEMSAHCFLKYIMSVQFSNVIVVRDYFHDYSKVFNHNLIVKATTISCI